MDSIIDKYLENDDSVDDIEYFDESKKSNFVGKLIGLGVLKREGDKLVKNKDWDNEKVKKQLKKKVTPRKVVHKVKKKIKKIMN